MKSRIYFVLAALLIFGLIGGCASGKGGANWGDPDSGVMLQFHQDVGAVNKYQIVSESGQEMEVMGNVMETSSNSELIIIHKINEVTAENVIHDISFEKYEVTNYSEMQGENTPDAKDVLGKSLIVNTLKNGKNVKFVTKDFPVVAGEGGGQPLEIALISVLTELPDVRVKVNDTWTGKQHFSFDKSGNTMETDSDNNYTLIGFETYKGFDCAKIKTVVKVLLTGTMEQMGNWMDFEGAIEGTGIIYFAYNEGFVVEMTGENTGEMTISVEAMNMVIPMTIEDKTTVSYIQQ